MKKVKVTSIKGHYQGENFYPQFCELEITDEMLKNMPDRFSVIVPEGEKVLPIKVKKVKRELAKDPVKTESKGGLAIKTQTASNDKPEKFVPEKKDEYPSRIGNSHWYRLSNKKKVQGKAQAFAAEKALE